MGKTLYNETQKTSFMNDIAGSPETIRNMTTLFTATAPYEARYGMDICSMGEKELQEVLDRVCGVQYRTRYNRLQILRRYAQWANEKELKGATDALIGSAEPGLSMVRETCINNPEHLQLCLDEVFDSEEEGTADNTFRCFFWLAYGGMSEETIHTVKAEDVDFEEMVVRHGNETAVLYRQALTAVERCASMSSFRYKNQAYVEAGDIWRSRCDGESILRGIRGSSSVTAWRAKLSRRMARAREKNAGIPQRRLTYGHVWTSGVFYRVRQAEIAGIRPDFLSVAMLSERGARAMSGDDIEHGRIMLRRAAIEYERDYSNWKQIIRMM